MGTVITLCLTSLPSNDFRSFEITTSLSCRIWTSSSKKRPCSRVSSTRPWTLKSLPLTNVTILPSRFNFNTKLLVNMAAVFVLTFHVPVHGCSGCRIGAQQDGCVIYYWSAAISCENFSRRASTLLRLTPKSEYPTREAERTWMRASGASILNSMSSTNRNSFVLKTTQM